MDENENTELTPEALAQLEDADITARRGEIEARTEEIGDATSDEAVAELEALADEYEALGGELDRRVEAEQARADRAEAARSRIAGAEASAEGDGPEGDEGDEDGDEEGGDGDDAGAEADAEDRELVGAEAGQGGIQTLNRAQRRTLAKGAAARAKANGNAPATTRPRIPAKRSAAELNKARPGNSKPAQTAPTRWAAGVGAPAGIGEFSDIEAIAEAIVKRRDSMGNVPAGTTDYMSIATAAREFEKGMISADFRANQQMFADLISEAQTIVASGACCTPFSPLYDICRLAEAQNPVEQMLPSINAIRGGIRHIVPPDYRAAFAGIGQTDCATTPNATKPCVHVDCPAVQDEGVVAISQCVSFDNLHYRTFPEQVRAFLDDLAVAFAKRKEVFYLDYIDNHSTPVTGFATGYGADRALLWDWVTGAVGYRKRNGMRRGAPLDLLAPDWSMDAVKLSMAMNGTQGLDYWAISDSQAMAFLQALGLNPTWYNDNPTSDPTQAFADPQAAGPLNTWPANVQSYLFSPGTFARLDGGSLDVGLVRDSVLNGTNDLQLFSEEWIGMAMLCIESVRITTPICPNGAAADLVAPFTC